MGNSNGTMTNSVPDVNNFINLVNEGYVCDEACQNAKTAESLKQTYQQAKLNAKNAPQELEVASKNYYTFVDGENSYNQQKNNELNDKADKITSVLQNNFNKSLKEAQIFLQSYNGMYLNLTNVIELLNKYLKENKNLEKDINNISSDILTNDRKTYYEDQNIDKLKTFYKWMKYIYIFIVVVYLFCIFLIPPQISIKKEIFIFVLLVLYPFIIHPIFRLLNWIYEKIMSIIPKNVYKTL
jgi:hypothetical protein